MILTGTDWVFTHLASSLEQSNFLSKNEGIQSPRMATEPVEFAMYPFTKVICLSRCQIELAIMGSIIGENEDVAGRQIRLY